MCFAEIGEHIATSSLGWLFDATYLINLDLCHLLPALRQTPLQLEVMTFKLVHLFLRQCFCGPEKKWFCVGKDRTTDAPTVVGKDFAFCLAMDAFCLIPELCGLWSLFGFGVNLIMLVSLQ